MAVSVYNAHMSVCPSVQATVFVMGRHTAAHFVSMARSLLGPMQALEPPPAPWLRDTVYGKTNFAPVGPFQGIHWDTKDFFLISHIRFRVLNHRFFVFPRVPGGFWELREACRKHFHLSWYLSNAVVTSYDPKTSLRGISTARTKTRHIGSDTILNFMGFHAFSPTFQVGVVRFSSELLLSLLLLPTSSSTFAYSQLHFSNSHKETMSFSSNIGDDGIRQYSLVTEILAAVLRLRMHNSPLVIFFTYILDNFASIHVSRHKMITTGRMHWMQFT